MPSRQQRLSAYPRATAQLPALGPWHGDNHPQTAGRRGRGRTRRSCSPAPCARRSRRA